MAESLQDPSFLEHEVQEQVEAIKHEIEDSKMNSHNLCTEVTLVHPAYCGG